jgi:hypothetical protein
LSPLDLLSRVQYLQPLGLVVDWGCGPNEGPISSQVRRLDCDVLVSVDAWDPYIAKIRDEVFSAKSRIFVQSDVLEALTEIAVGLSGKKIDLSICLDIVEHLEDAKAVNFLLGLQAISKAILVWIPIGYAPIDRDTYGGENHELHKHRSTWSVMALELLGFEVELLENFHTPMFGHRVDAAWAYWRIDEVSSNR